MAGRSITYMGWPKGKKRGPRPNRNATEDTPQKRNIRVRTLRERREILAAVAAWVYQQPSLRDPLTLKELARLLDVPYRTILDYKSRLPKTLDEFIEAMRISSLAHSMVVMNNLIYAKDKDEIAAGKIIFQEIIQPKMRGKHEKPTELPKEIIEAFQRTPGNQARRKLLEKQIESKRDGPV